MIHLCHPGKFSNIFLAIGSLYLEENSLWLLEKYLESSGIQKLMIEEEIFGPALLEWWKLYKW